MTDIALQGGGYRATVSTAGAELRALSGPDGGELVWHGGPEWPRHAPVLFPVIGRVEGDEVRVDGATFPMPQHGFARDAEWSLCETSASRVRLRLRDSPRTRQHYPYRFTLTATYEVGAAGLTVLLSLTNDGDTPMPYALGWHPAFRWPLDPACDRSDHTLTFEHPEGAPVRRVRDVLLLPEEEPTPVLGRTLALAEEHFADGAIILPTLRSRSLTYGAPAGRRLRIDWDGTDHLAVWTPLDGDLLCLEPWRGLPSHVGFRGDLAAMPGPEVLAARTGRLLRLGVGIAR